jgi:hypothetical protein
MQCQRARQRARLVGDEGAISILSHALINRRDARVSLSPRGFVLLNLNLTLAVAEIVKRPA